MALSDILQRIAADAEAEAAAIVAEADRRSGALLADARTAAARSREAAVARSATEAVRRAETLVANARLAARDDLLAAKRALIAEALRRAREGIVALPDDEYADLLAKRVAAAAHGGERVLIAPPDRERLRERLPAAVERLAGDLALSYPDEPAPLERGVLLAGERVREEVSPESLLAAREGELAALAAGVLFGEGA